VLAGIFVSVRFLSVNAFHVLFVPGKERRHDGVIEKESVDSVWACRIVKNYLGKTIIHMQKPFLLLAYLN